MRTFEAKDGVSGPLRGAREPGSGKSDNFLLRDAAEASIVALE